MVRLIKTAVIPKKYPRKYTFKERVGQGLGKGLTSEPSYMCKIGKHASCAKLNCTCGCHKDGK